MSEQLTLYLQVEGEVEDQAERLATAIRGLEPVIEVVVHREPPVRSGVQIIQEITLTVTALGGAVGATNFLVDQIQKLLAKFRVKSAEVETKDGVRQLPVEGAPRSENPGE